MSQRSWVGDLEDLHAKFGDMIALVSAMDPLVRREFLKFRIAFLGEELRETMEARTPEDVVDGLIDICVVAIGTLHAFGVDGRRAWDVVHRANMAKNPGSNPNRPNRFGLPDLVKPEGWKSPSHAGNTGMIQTPLFVPVEDGPGRGHVFPITVPPQGDSDG
jgi:hypothetical protein